MVEKKNAPRKAASKSLLKSAKALLVLQAAFGILFLFIGIYNSRDIRPGGSPDLFFNLIVYLLIGPAFLWTAFLTYKRYVAGRKP